MTITTDPVIMGINYPWSIAHTIPIQCYQRVVYSGTWELGTPKGLRKSVLNSQVVLFLRSISTYWILLRTEAAVLNSQGVPISQVVLKTGFTVIAFCLVRVLLQAQRAQGTICGGIHIELWSPECIIAIGQQHPSTHMLEWMVQICRNCLLRFLLYQ